MYFLFTIEVAKKDSTKIVKPFFVYVSNTFTNDLSRPVRCPTGSTVKNQVRIPCLQRRY